MSWRKITSAMVWVYPTVLGVGAAIALSACGSSGPTEKTSTAASQALSDADCDEKGANCTCPAACVCVGESCKTCSCDVAQCHTRACQQAQRGDKRFWMKSFLR